MLGYYVVFNTCQNTQFTLYGYPVLVGILNYLFGQLNVFLVRMVRTINHYGRETIVDTLFTNFKSVAMVEVQNDGNFVA